MSQQEKLDSPGVNKITAMLIAVVTVLCSSSAMGEECVAGKVKKTIIKNQITLEKNPADRVVRTDLARCYMIENDLVSADKHVDILLKGNANDIEALLIKALVFYRKQDWHSAENIYLRVIELNPDNAESYMVLGDIYAALNDTDKSKWYQDQYKKLVNNK